MRSFNIIFVVLLLYIIAALTFWWFSLEKQSSVIAATDIELLELKHSIKPEDPLYDAEMRKIVIRENSRQKQYIGEGLTFLLVTLAGAYIVYRAAKKTLQLGEQQNNFMLSVTHELKSPVAGIKLGLQTLQKHHLPQQTKDRLLNQSLLEANRLDDLCNNILVASQIEANQYKTVKESVDLSELLNVWASNYKNVYEPGITLDIQPNIFANTDRLLFEMAINNLLTNAIKYGNKKPIAIMLSADQNHVYIKVADHGYGIADDEKKRIFEKFYRIGSENTRRTKGTGLGLYLTDKILQQHNGTITALNNNPEGSVFEVVLPR